MISQNSFSIDVWQERASHILEELKGVDAFRMLNWADPWSQTSLNGIEQNMLDTWASDDAIPADLTAQYQAFLGEGLRRRFGGTWIALEPEIIGEASTHMGLGIKYPVSESIDVVSSLIPFAYRTGAGTWWSSCFRITEQMTTSAL